MFRTFTDRVLSKRTDLIYVIRGNNSRGERVWYYVQVLPPKLKEFKVALESGNLKVTEFAKILYHGVGENPTEEVRQIMIRDYNCS
ncbi:MAG: hypothetical protein R3B84_04050 [Zavarzinella sp.]